MKGLLPISAVVPTLDRPAALGRTLESLSSQGVLPAELIVIDGSSGAASKAVVEQYAAQWAPRCAVVWRKASELGAAVQRNQGVELATQRVLWFFDDDIVFEEGCLRRLWQALEADHALAGVNAMITNQSYHPPGFVSRMVFAVLDRRRKSGYAGRVLGPAVNLLPEDRSDLPEVVPVEWLNTTCTLYKREALPDPPFDSVFTGYSLMEDLVLSLRVGRNWKLANVRLARIFHDSQPGAYKSDLRALSCMELVNRHYVMTQVLQRVRMRDYCKLFFWELFQLTVAAINERLGTRFWLMLQGKWRAMKKLSGSGRKNAQNATAKK
jgi:glycosyltransferase involved in cell wall biosynthesis